MEHNVVTLDTAKRLQAAGFPQDTAVEWLERPVNRPEHRWELAMPWQSKFIQGGYAAPTAQEIADQLPGDDLYRVSKVIDSYVAYSHDDKRRSRPSGEADTMAEALALLWLKLKAEAK